MNRRCTPEVMSAHLLLADREKLGIMENERNFERKFRPLSVEESLICGGLNPYKLGGKIKRLIKFILEYSSDFISGFKIGKSTAL